MIVATAGHIDHGKTRLVRALTGVETDRLPEEKARGLTIEPGFAYLPLAEDDVLGFVDVPGHERFIRNMVAGVSGIDFALLVVAADDGVMPQTVEHVQILDMLRVGRGAVAVTKTDRVDADRRRRVADAVRVLLRPTTLAESPVFFVSSRSGDGVEPIRQFLIHESWRVRERDATAQHFRFAIDRAFTVAGVGTVVTGTVWSGMVARGDRLVLSPVGLDCRVRGLRIHERSADAARVGQRCALNLAGVTVSRVRRGDWVVAEALHRPTNRLDVHLSVLGTESRPLRHGSTVHFHAATAHTTARLVLPGGGAVAPGAGGFARMILEHPIAALRGDRLIVRDPSASRTTGGGLVLDPFPPAGRRRGRPDPDRLRALAREEAKDALTDLGGIGPVDLEEFGILWNLTATALDRAARSGGLLRLGKGGRIGLSEGYLRGLHDRLPDYLAREHRCHPHSAGVAVRVLHRDVAPDLPWDAFEDLVADSVRRGRLAVEGRLARQPGHFPQVPERELRLWQRAHAAFIRESPAPLGLAQLLPEVDGEEESLRSLFARKAREGELVSLGRDRFCLASILAWHAATAATLAGHHPDGRFKVAQFKESAGIGRRAAVAVLEGLDSLGITLRRGDERSMGRDFRPILGDGLPPPVAPSRSRVRRGPHGGRHGQ